MVVSGGEPTEVLEELARLSIILGMEGDIPRVSGVFFKAVVQAVLLFSAEKWVMTPQMGQDLGVSNTGS